MEHAKIERKHIAQIALLLLPLMLIFIGSIFIAISYRVRKSERYFGDPFFDTFDGAKPRLLRRGSKAPLSINPEQTPG